MKRPRRSYCIFCFILFFAGCGGRQDQTSLELEKFKSVYLELSALNDRHPTPEPVLLDSSRLILEKHGFTKEMYDRSVAYFHEHPERWESFYRELLSQMTPADGQTRSSAPQAPVPGR